METSCLLGDKERSCIDMRLLPIKVHYFLIAGALAGVKPYLPVLAKSLNIHATAIGIIYTLIPFAVLLTKPLFGGISDHFRNIRKVLISITAFAALAYLFVLLIPSFQLQHEATVSITCQDASSNSTLPVRYDPKCLLERVNQGALCHIANECAATTEETFTTRTDQICDPIDINISASINVTSDVHFTVCRRTDFKGNTSYVSSSSRNVSTCSCAATNHLSLNCTPSFQDCAVTSPKEDHSEVYRSFQFWIFLLLALIGTSGSSAVFSLNDAACYELLGDRAALYGRQRMFGTLGWGAVAFLAGYFNDLASAITGSESYAPGFYLMTVMSVMDLIILWKVLDLQTSAHSESIWKDIGSLFSSCRTVVFATAVVVVGGLTGMLWSYQFWYLQSLGASQLLLGLTLTVQSLVAEVPFFFFSGWFIERLGHSLCLIITFFAFALRYFLYYLLTNPWYILPMEILHGWTFGIFYSTMTSYASQCAPPGTEATMQGILGGLFEGLGVAIGSLLSGVAFDQLGGRLAFVTAAVISACSGVLFSAVMQVTKRQ